MRIRNLLMATMALAFLAPMALAQDLAADRPTEVSADEAPARFTYSGLLTTAEGDALADGPRSLVFRGYASPEAARLGGAPDWEEAHEVAVVGGRFLTVLGSRDDVPPDVHYVTIAVDGEAASAPVRLGRGEGSDGFAPGNTLQDSYDNGRIIDTTTGGAMQIRGALNSIGLIVRDITPVFITSGLTRFRLTSTGGAGRIWEYRVYGAGSTRPAGTFSIADATGGGSDGFIMAPGVGEDVLTLTGQTAQIGSPNNQAGLLAYTTPDPAGPGTGLLNFQVRDYFSHGAQALLHDEAGVVHTLLQPDGTGSGGFLHVTGPNNGLGFLVNGNISGTGTLVSIGNGASASFFNTTSAGSGTVTLPVNAIQASEILDEAGTANATDPNGVTLTQGQQNVTLSRSITAPSAGFVIAYASSELRITHTTGTTDFVRYSVSQDCDATPTVPATQQSDYGIPSGAGSGTYQYVTTVQGLFSVTAGTTTFCAQVNPLTAGTSAVIDDQNLTLLFVPTAYGSTQSNLGEGADEDDRLAAQSALTASDIQAERAASIQGNEARVLAEMAEMRARMAELEASMTNDR